MGASRPFGKRSWALRLLGQEHERVEHTRNHAPHERADRVHLPLAEVPGGDRGAEPSAGADRGPREVATDEPAHRRREADREARHLFRRPPRVDCGREDDEYQEEREDEFDDDAEDRGYGGSIVESRSETGRPQVAKGGWIDREEEQPGEHAPGELEGEDRRRERRADLPRRQE